MRKLKLILSLLLITFAVGVNAQNTGVNPYTGSIHKYNVTKGTIGNTDLLWSITTGVANTDYIIKSAVNAPELIVQWLTAGSYKVQLSETRNDIALACPTLRILDVTVIANNFDVIASLSSAKDECATVMSPVDDVNANGDNADDNFGTTTREFKVTASGLQTTVNWSFDYAISSSDAALGDYNVVVDNTNATVNNNSVVVNAATTEITITVSYQTNKNRQDQDVDLELVLTKVLDQNLTPEKDTANNTVSYQIKALPATSGITTDN